MSTFYQLYFLRAALIFIALFGFAFSNKVYFTSPWKWSKDSDDEPLLLQFRPSMVQQSIQPPCEESVDDESESNDEESDDDNETDKIIANSDEQYPTLLFWEAETNAKHALDLFCYCTIHSRGKEHSVENVLSAWLEALHWSSWYKGDLTGNFGVHDDAGNWCTSHWKTIYWKMKNYTRTSGGKVV